MTTPHAGQYGPESFSDVHTGRLLRDTPAAFYEVGTTTPRTRYSDRLRTTTVTAPLTTDSDGNLVVFAEPGPADLVIAATRLTIVVPPDAADVAELLAGAGTTPVHKFEGITLTNVEDLTAFAAQLRAGSVPDGTTILLPAQTDSAQIGGYTFHVNDGDVPPALEFTAPAGSVLQFGDLVTAGQSSDGRQGFVYVVGPDGLSRVNPDRPVPPAFAAVDPASGSDDSGPLLTIRSDVLVSRALLADVGPTRIGFTNPGPGRWGTVLVALASTVPNAQVTWVGRAVNHSPQPVADGGVMLVQALVIGTADPLPDLDLAGVGQLSA